ncbi:hypothetical protein T552_01531 [Pneumocystis carinii B80]|uniref:Pre-rRNA-processing protein IPI3 n=1 Tax=Pneumocystis carinii (strain B80) TaxID=1408658 RepID=A0A0W4ZKK3_PNEC8|nr:hypothetical protein T552_01531 [Pneumocystis carinii B80]KTW28903.1 hypothetical protein T552_01531 [Pneumocystis carinii B80]
MNQGNFQEIIVIGYKNEGILDDTNIYVYDMYTGSQIMKFKQNDCCLRGVFITENYVFCSQREKPILHIYCWEKESIYQKMVIPEILTAFAVSHDVYWAVGGTIQGKIYVWQITSGNLMFVHEAHYQKIAAITFVMDDGFFLTGSEDCYLCLWSLSDILDLYGKKDRGPVKTWNNHTLGITDIVCGYGTTNSARVFTSSLDSTVNVWDLNTQSLLTTFVFPKPITCLVVDPAERAFYAGNDQGDVYLVDLYGIAQEKSLESFYEAIGGSGKVIQSVKDESTIFKGHKSAISCLALSFDGSLLITGSQDHDVFIWDIATRQIIQTFSKQNGPITSICCKVIYRGFFESKKSLQNIPTFKKVQNFQDMNDYSILKKLNVFNELKNKTAWYEDDSALIKKDLTEFMSITSESALQLHVKNLQNELQTLYGYYSDLREVHQELWKEYMKTQIVDHDEN